MFTYSKIMSLPALALLGVLCLGTVTPAHASDWVSAAGKPAPAGFKSVLPLLATANVNAGKEKARVCQMCHSFKEGGPNKMGPHLYNIVGRKHASAAGYSYSSEMKSIKGKWTYAALDSFLYSPQDYAPGTKMPFPGIKDTQQRADVIAYLRTLSEKPAPLPATHGHIVKK